MRTLEGNAETAFPNQGLKGFPDGRAFQHADGVRFRCFTIADDTSLVAYMVRKENFVLVVH
jgi:hypothetical protein